MSPTVYEPGTNAPTAESAATTRTRAIWTSGDFGRIAAGYAPSSAEFITRLGLKQGERVLDVACGTGNLAIPAARAGAITTGIDIAPNLIEQAIALAADEGLDIRFEVGDADALDVADASFDTVVSMFGVMFTAHPQRAASELLRVTRRGGRIALANWTPSGFIGEMLRTVVAYAPPPAGAPSTLLWGKQDIVRERLAGVQQIEFACRHAQFNYQMSPADTVQRFLEYYGPTLRAYTALDPESQDAMRRDLVELWSTNNRATDGTTRVESEYLEVIAIR